MKRTEIDLPERLPPAGDVDLPDREAFYRRRPPGAFTAALAGRRGHVPWLPALGFASAVAVAVAVVVAVAMPRPDPGTAPAGEALPAFGASGLLRDKGTVPEPHSAPTPVGLSVVVQQGKEAAPLVDGAHLPPAARVRFLYDNTEYGYLMLVSVTGDGTVSPLYPPAEGPSIPVAPGLGIPLQGAVELDGYLGPERFFALFSATPLAFEQVRDAAAAALRDAAPGDVAAWLRGLARLPLGCAQATLLIEKTPSHEARDG
jgi:hypothetical protein